MDPIQVNASPLRDQLWTGMRQIAPVAMAFALGRHWIPEDAAPLLGAVGLMVWPIVAGQLKTRERAQNLATLAAIVPDDKAVLK